MCLLSMIGTAYASYWTLQQNYNTRDDTSANLYLDNYFSQTFTTGSDIYTLESVRLKLYGVGTTGDIYCKIRTTNSSGYPDGGDIASGAYQGALITTSTSGLWYEIPMTNIVLSASTTYSIVCYGTGTTIANDICWRYDNGSAGNYSGGQMFNSSNGGTTWTPNTNSSDMMFEVWGYPTNTIKDIKVFQGYSATGDWLVVASYDIESSCNQYTYPWYMQLVDSSGTAVYQSQVLQCRYKVGCVQISPAGASSLVVGGNYSVKLVGNFGLHPNISQTINASDWKGTDMSNLDGWVMEQAGYMQSYYNISYIDSVATSGVNGQALNAYGGGIFDAGIPYLSSYRPNIFEVTVINRPIVYNISNVSSTYAADLYNNWSTFIGPDVSAVLVTEGAYFSIGGRMMGAILTFIGFVSLAMFSKTISFLIIIGGVVVGLFPMSLVYVLVFLLAVILVRSLFWSST